MLSPGVKSKKPSIAHTVLFPGYHQSGGRGSHSLLQPRSEPPGHDHGWGVKGLVEHDEIRQSSSGTQLDLAGHSRRGRGGLCLSLISKRTSSELQVKKRQLPLPRKP